MGIISAQTSVTRYFIAGELKKPVIDAITEGLKKQAITDIDGNPSDQAMGWTSFHTPYEPNFDDASFLIGHYVVFALRIDKKSIPSKLVQKQYTIESTRKLKTVQRDFLSKDEKKAIKENVLATLNLKIPATPSVYDIVWQYEAGELWFFSNLKNSNEILESLFLKSFGLKPIRQIPYTVAFLDKTLTDTEREALNIIAKSDYSD